MLLQMHSSLDEHLYEINYSFSILPFHLLLLLDITFTIIIIVYCWLPTVHTPTRSLRFAVINWVAFYLCLWVHNLIDSGILFVRTS
jgi:hypothetical protein